MAVAQCTAHACRSCRLLQSGDTGRQVLLLLIMLAAKVPCGSWRRLQSTLLLLKSVAGAAAVV
jgi:hypothetical protein